MKHIVLNTGRLGTISTHELTDYQIKQVQQIIMGKTIDDKKHQHDYKIENIFSEENYYEDVMEDFAIVVCSTCGDVRQELIIK